MIFSPTFPYREIILHDQLSDKNMFWYFSFKFLFNTPFVSKYMHHNIS